MTTYRRYRAIAVLTVALAIATGAAAQTDVSAVDGQLRQTMISRHKSLSKTLKKVQDKQNSGKVDTRISGSPGFSEDDVQQLAETTLGMTSDQYERMVRKADKARKRNGTDALNHAGKPGADCNGQPPSKPSRTEKFLNGYDRSRRRLDMALTVGKHNARKIAGKIKSGVTAAKQAKADGRLLSAARQTISNGAKASTKAAIDAALRKKENTILSLKKAWADLYRKKNPTDSRGLGSAIAMIKLMQTGLASLDAEFQTAKRENRDASYWNFVKNFTCNAVGITAANGALTTTQFETQLAYIKMLQYYNSQGEDVSSLWVNVKAAMWSTAYGTSVGVYEGAKLLPVIGDGIGLYESGRDTLLFYRDVEAANRMIAGNEKLQGEQMDQAVGYLHRRLLDMKQARDILQAKIDRMYQRCAQLGKTAEQLHPIASQWTADMELVSAYAQAAQTQRDQAGASDQIAKAPEILKRIEAVTAEAAKNRTSAENVLKGHTSGKLAPQAVVTQSGFIADLFGRTESDYRQALARAEALEALATGPVTAEQAAEAWQRAQQTGQQILRTRLAAEESVLAYYQDYNHITIISEQFQKDRKLLATQLDTFASRAKLDSAQEDKLMRWQRVLAGLTINVREVAAVQKTAKNLELHLARLRKLSDSSMPEFPEAARAEPALDEAREAWQRLADPVERMNRAVAAARAAVDRLKQLAAGLKPETPKADPIAVSTPIESIPKDLASLSWSDLRKRTHLHPNQKSRWGFDYHRSSDAKPDGPRLDGFCRVVDRGRIGVWDDRNRNGRQDSDEPTKQVPYFGWYRLSLSASTSTGQGSSDSWQFRNLQYRSKIIAERLIKSAGRKSHLQRRPGRKGIDTLLAGTILDKTYKGDEYYRQFECIAATGSLVGRVTVEPKFQVGTSNVYCQTRGAETYSSSMKFADPGTVASKIAALNAGTEPTALSVTTAALRSARAFEDFNRRNYFWSIVGAVPQPGGFTVTQSSFDRSGCAAEIVFKRAGTFSWAGDYGKPQSREWSESYHIHMRASIPLSGSWQRDIADLRSQIRSRKVLSQYTTLNTGLSGTDAQFGMRRTRESTFGGANQRRISRYWVAEDVEFCVRNVRVSVSGIGHYVERPQLHAAEVAQQIKARLGSVGLGNKMLPPKGR